MFVKNIGIVRRNGRGQGKMKKRIKIVEQNSFYQCFLGEFKVIDMSILKSGGS